MEIWFWQLIVSPHMAGLAKALSDAGVKVQYIAQTEMSEERKGQGWTLPELGEVSLRIAENSESALRIAAEAPIDAIHICQGVRGNGIIGKVQLALKRLNRRQYIVMETVDDSGRLGWLKRAVYFWKFRKLKDYISGVLATGSNTCNWIIERGMSSKKVFPFAYFLPTAESTEVSAHDSSAKFRVLFVGQFIPLKRLELLIVALSRLSEFNFELAVVGSGPLESELKQKAISMLPGRVDWIGKLSINHVRTEMQRADCLVLPSRHDGWGAVVSEALIAGTPAICSDKCGSKHIVELSGVGGVFRSGDIEDLCDKLTACMLRGKLNTTESSRLASWAGCIGAEAGARYLIDIISASDMSTVSLIPPWENEKLYPRAQI